MITCWQTVEQVVILFRIPGLFPVFNNLNVSLFEVFLYALKKVVFVPCLECIRVFFGVRLFQQLSLLLRVALI